MCVLNKILQHLKTTYIYRFYKDNKTTAPSEHTVYKAPACPIFLY